MRLKSLELYGFKSFADRTKFDFEPGMTCIVGPNGCGKSNVTDALRWVMGEQSVKSMRGGEMNDVIFAGSQRRKHLGFAEVVIVFDNEDRRLPVETDEVSVGRRLYWSDGTGSEAEYFINKELCRLKDVKDLLMDTGVGTTSYCFIQQGQIDRLLESNAKERRLVFEEAAGISKYRTRKRRALGKLDRVERNLEQLNSIREEVEKNYRRASRQAQTARRYKKHMDQLREKQIVLALADFRALREEKAKLDVELARVREIEADAAARAASAEGRVTEAEAEDHGLDARAREADKLSSDAQAAAERLEAESRSAESHAQDLLAQIETGKGETAELSSQVDERRKELRCLEESKKELEGSVADEERSLGAAEAAAKEAATRADDLAAALKTWQEKAFATVQAHSEAQNELARAESELKNLGHRVERLEKELAQIDGAYKEAHETAEEANGRCGQLRDRIEAANASAAATREETCTLERQLTRLDAMIAKQRGDLETKKARLSLLLDLVRRADGVAAGAHEVVKAVKTGTEFGKAYGLVADLVKARPEFEAAIETAMGGLASDVVVDSSSTASKAIDFLSRERLGRASFLPLDRMCRTALIPDELVKEKGVVGRGCDLLEYDKRFRPVFEYLLGRVLVVEDRGVAVKMARLAGPGTRMVTLDGEIVDGTGPMTGGISREARPGLLSRRTEIKQLRASLVGATKMLETLLGQRERIEKRRSAARERAEQLATEARRLEGLFGEAKAGLASLRREEKKLNERRLVAAADYDVANRDRQTVAGKMEELRSRSRELEAEQRAAQEKAESISAEIEIAREERTARASELADRGTALATLREKLRGRVRAIEDLRRDVEQRERSLRARRDELDRNDERVKELRREAEEARHELASRSEEFEKLATAAGEMRARREEIRSELDSMRAAAKEARAEHDAARSDLSEFRVGENEITLRLETAEDRAVTEFSVSLVDRLAKYEEGAARREMRLKQEAAAAAGLEGGGDHPSELGPGMSGPEDGQAPAAPTEEAAEAAPAEAQAAGESGDESDSKPEVDYEQGIPEPTPELRAEIDDLKRKIGAMGRVNMFALEEAKEFGDRARFLKAQYEDLAKARRSLKDLIARINRKSRTLFQETFDAVRANFQEIFRKLFGGGKADVFLEEGVDILEAGIEIKAQPPGRKEQPLSLLSGGQKAMTTIALLFAIFRTKPSPFCILDEVDAPLDDSNVDRYNQMLLEYTDKTQFIVITHNKATMAYADLLYGVTMQEAGVSRKVSIRLEEVDAHLHLSDEVAEAAGKAKAA